MKLVRCTRCKHHWIEWRSGQSCPKCTTRFDLTPPPLPEVTAEVTAPRPPDQFQHQNQCTNCGTCSTGFNYCPTCGGINVPLINGRPIPRGPSSDRSVRFVIAADWSARVALNSADPADASGFWS